MNTIEVIIIAVMITFIIINPNCDIWLRHWATSLKVAGSIPDGIFGILHRRNPFSRTVSLGSTQILTAMSTGNAYWR